MFRDHCPKGSCYAITAAMSKASNEGGNIFTSLLNYQIYKQVKMSLGGRFVSSYLLLSSTDSQKKNNPKITQHFLCFQEMQLTGFPLISSLHCTYCQHLMKELIFLMWPVKQEHNILYALIKTNNVFANENG